jgi:hypothetical protein
LSGRIKIASPTIHWPDIHIPSTQLTWHGPVKN